MFFWPHHSINTHPIFLTISLLGISVLIICVGNKKDETLIWAPCITAVLFILLSVIEVFLNPFEYEGPSNLYSDEEVFCKIQLVKRNTYIALSCLSLCPIIYLNIERLSDLASN